MKLRFQFGEWVLTAACVAAMALPCAAQSRDNKPHSQPKPQQAPRQERRQPQQQGGRAQSGRPRNDRPHNNAPANRPSPNKQTESMGMIGGDRPPNARGESGQRPDLNPKEKKNYEDFRRLPPQKQQEIRDRERQWGKLTPEQQGHIKNDLFPKW